MRIFFTTHKLRKRKEKGKNENIMDKTRKG